MPQPQIPQPDIVFNSSLGATRESSAPGTVLHGNLGKWRGKTPRALPATIRNALHEAAPVTADRLDAFTDQGAELPPRALAQFLLDLACAAVCDLGHRVYSRKLLKPPDSESGYCMLFYDVRSGDIGQTAGFLAYALLTLALHDRHGPIELDNAQDSILASLPELFRYKAHRRESLTSRAIIAAAGLRDIPVTLPSRLAHKPGGAESISDERTNPGYMLLGYGKYGRQILHASIEGAPRRIAPRLEDRRALYRQLLDWGLPAPRHELGAGELTDIHGGRLRLLVIGSRVAAACEVPPLAVTGDGRCSVRALIAALNQGRGHTCRHRLAPVMPLPPIVDQLELHGFTLDSVPDNGQSVCLDANPPAAMLMPLSDIAAQLDDTLKRAAIQAVSRLGLGLAGVDIVTGDPGLPLESTGGAIIGIEASPDLGLHRRPGEAIPLEVAGELLDHLFPAGTPSRIPIVAITGTNGKTTTSRMVAAILRGAGHRVGLACTGSFEIDGQDAEDVGPGMVRAIQLLAAKTIDRAVVEAPLGMTTQKGVPWDHCNVGVCTNIARDHMENLEDIAHYKGVIMETARDWAVLNAEDPHCLSMAPRLKARRLCLVSLDPDTPAVREHARRGGTAVVLKETSDGHPIVVRKGERETPLMLAEEIPATWRACARHNISNAMSAVAAALGLDVPLDVIRQTLGNMGTSAAETPGRLNLYAGLPFSVILDYAHNAHGYRALADTVRGMGVAGRKTIVTVAAGDRFDRDLEDIGRAVAGCFNHYIIREPVQLQGNRAFGETSALIKRGLVNAGVPQSSIDTINELKPAIDLALSRAQPGDLVVIATGNLYREVHDLLDAYPNDLNPESSVDRFVQDLT